MGPLLIPLPLAKSGTFPSGPNRFTLFIFLKKEIEIGVEQESDGMPIYAESKKKKKVPGITLVSVTLP